MTPETKPRPKRGWNTALYEPKTHWPNRANSGSHCGKRSGFYDALKITGEPERVTCVSCAKAARAEKRSDANPPPSHEEISALAKGAM